MAVSKEKLLRLKQLGELAFIAGDDSTAQEVDQYLRTQGESLGSGLAAPKYEGLTPPKKTPFDLSSPAEVDTRIQTGREGQEELSTILRSMARNFSVTPEASVPTREYESRHPGASGLGSALGMNATIGLGAGAANAIVRAIPKATPLGAKAIHVGMQSAVGAATSDVNKKTLGVPNPLLNALLFGAGGRGMAGSSLREIETKKNIASVGEQIGTQLGVRREVKALQSIGRTQPKNFPTPNALVKYEYPTERAAAEAKAEAIRKFTMPRGSAQFGQNLPVLASTKRAGEARAMDFAARKYVYDTLLPKFKGLLPARGAAIRLPGAIFSQDPRAQIGRMVASPRNLSFLLKIKDNPYLLKAAGITKRVGPNGEEIVFPTGETLFIGE